MKKVQENGDNDDERVMRGRWSKGWSSYVSGGFLSKYLFAFAAARASIVTRAATHIFGSGDIEVARTRSAHDFELILTPFFFLDKILLTWIWKTFSRLIATRLEYLPSEGNTVGFFAY